MKWVERIRAGFCVGIKVLFSLLILPPVLVALWIMRLATEYRFSRPKFLTACLGRVTRGNGDGGYSRRRIARLTVKPLPRSSANMVRLLEVEYEGIPERDELVFKKYLLFGSLYAFLGCFLGAYPHSRVLPAERHTAERAGVEQLRKMGLAAAEIVHVDLTRRITLFRFVPGKRLDRYFMKCRATGQLSKIETLAYRYGQALATIHGANCSIGDGHLCNLIYDEESDTLCFTDLELFSGPDKVGWDMAYGLNTLGTALDERERRGVEEAFQRGYCARGHLSWDRHATEVACHRRHLRGFNRVFSMA